MASEAQRSLAPGGTYLILGYASGTIPRLAANVILMANRSAVGVDINALSRADHSAIPQLLTEVVDAIGDGRITPPHPTIRPVDEVHDVFVELSNGSALGRTVIDMRGGQVA